MLDTHFDTPALFSRPGWDIADRHAVTKARQPGRPAAHGRRRRRWRLLRDLHAPRGRAPRPATCGSRRPPWSGQSRSTRCWLSTPTRSEIALTADDAPRIVAKGKRFAYLSMENA
ncbi:hypothetical protein ACRAWD_20380 [Caulobacter segnis]